MLQSFQVHYLHFAIILAVAVFLVQFCVSLMTKPRPPKKVKCSSSKLLNLKCSGVTKCYLTCLLNILKHFTIHVSIYKLKLMPMEFMLSFGVLHTGHATRRNYPNSLNPRMNPKRKKKSPTLNMKFHQVHFVLIHDEFLITFNC